MLVPQILHWTSLTGMVNEMKSPRSFLRNMFFSDFQTLSTENILWGEIFRGRSTAPFVKKNGQAIMVGGYNEREHQVSAPNISITRPLEAADLLFKRHAGDVIFADGSDVATAAEREVARQLQVLNDMVDNTEEWLCAQAIQGEISYTSADQDHFQITFSKPVGNTITLTDFWDTVDGAPIADITTAKQVFNDEVSLNVTDCVLGSEASAAFLANDEVRALSNAQANLGAGSVNLGADFDVQGARFLGVFGGVRFWEYAAEVEHQGSSVPLIRAKYAEFLHRGPMAEMKLYYGAIPDLDAFEGGMLASRRFSKSWRTPTPSVQHLLLMARPLPVLRRAGAVVSMKVVSG